MFQISILFCYIYIMAFDIRIILYRKVLRRSEFQLKPYSFGELEWISINLSKSAVFSLQTLEYNLTSP